MARKDTTIQGFLLHDDRCKLDNVAAVGAGATQSSYTEATPRPGQAIADDACARVRPQVHGVQTEDLRFGCVRGGNPGPDTAGMVWRKESETAAEWRSWNPPVCLEHFQWVELESTTAVDWDDKAIVKIPDTQTVVVLAHDVDATSPEANKASVYTPSSRSWSAQITVDSTWKGASLSMVYHPDICGILAFSTPQSGNGTAYISTDEGATWSQYAQGILDTAPSVLDGNARAEVDRYGNILLIMEASDVEVWVSTDAGHTFTQTESFTPGTVWVGFDTTTLPSGEIFVTFFANSDKVYGFLLGHAFDGVEAAISSAVAISGTGTHSALCCAADDDGVIYVTYRSVLSDEFTLHRSLDAGQTWEQFASSPYNADTTTTLHQLRAVMCCGEMMIVGAPSNPTSNGYEGSIVALQYGGWDNVEFDTTSSAVAKVTNRRAWTRTWISTELPGNNGWTSAGSGTVALSAAGWNYQSALGTAKNESQSVSFSSAQFGWEAEVQVVSGGLTTSTEVGFRIIRDNGTNRTILHVNMTTTGFRLLDNLVTTLDTITTDMATEHVQILVYYDTLSSVTVWYRLPSEATWTLANTYTLTTSATVSATNTLAFGHVATGSQTCESNWKWVAYSEDLQVRHTIAGASAYSGFRWGRGLDNRPYPVRDDGDANRRMRVSVGGSPARRGDTFDLDARYDHGIDKVFPQIAPSPRRAWRSTQIATAEDWVYDFGADTRFQPGSFLGLALVGKHVPRTVALATRVDGGGSWTTRGTYDGATGFTSLTYALSGDIVEASGGTEGGRYIHDNEYAGGYFVLDTGVTPKCRSILENTGGRWNGTTAEAAFRLDGIDGTEAATGTCHLVHPGGVLLIPFTAAAEFRYLRIQVAVQDLPDTYYTIGAHVVGGVLVPGHRMSRGWSMRAAPNTTFYADSYGTTYADKRGPVRREFTWSYQDLSDEKALLGSSSADHVSTGTGGVALAGYMDTYNRLLGMLIQTRGASLPMVAVLEVPDGTSATTITDRDLWVYGMLTGNVVQANHVLGHAGTDPVYRVESLTLTEIPWDLD